MDGGLCVRVWPVPWNACGCIGWLAGRPAAHCAGGQWLRMTNGRAGCIRRPARSGISYIARGKDDEGVRPRSGTVAGENANGQLG
jgi:hypothetical protein